MSPAQSCGSIQDVALLDTQQDVVNFQSILPAGCTEHEGSIEIRNATDLSPLSFLTSIGGNLTFRNNSGLTNLSGLDNLTTIGGNLIILTNPAMTNLSGLPAGITSIGGDLVIQSNTSLTTLSGLDNITSIGGDLVIRSNDILGNSGIADFCPLDQALVNFSGTYTVTDNALNPTQQEIVSAPFVLNSSCYSTLAEAVTAAAGSGTVQIQLSTDISSPVYIPLGVVVEALDGVALTNGSTINNDGTLRLTGTATFTNTGTYTGSGLFDGDFVNNGILKIGGDNGN